MHPSLFPSIQPTAVCNSNYNSKWHYSWEPAELQRVMCKLSRQDALKDCKSYMETYHRTSTLCCHALWQLLKLPKELGKEAAFKLSCRYSGSFYLISYVSLDVATNVASVVLTPPSLTRRTTSLEIKPSISVKLPRQHYNQMSNKHCKALTSLTSSNRTYLLHLGKCAAQ